jgi:hypothetical protein
MTTKRLGLWLGLGLGFAKVEILRDINGTMVSLNDKREPNMELETNLTEHKVFVHTFHLRSGQTKDYKIGFCCFSAKLAASRRKSK